MPTNINVIKRVTASSSWFETSWSTPGAYTDSLNIDINSTTGDLTLHYGSRIYIADYYNNRIVRTTINGSGWKTYGSYGGGIGQLNYPCGIFYDYNTGYIYIADSSNHRIVKTKMDGSYWTTYGSYGSGTGQFYYPGDIYYDSATEFIYITDRYNNRIVKTKINGNGWTTYGTFGTGTDQFNYPYGLFYDNTTNYVYVGDTYNNRIVKTTMSGSGWTTYGSMGSGTGQFYWPVGIDYDNETKYIYVSEWRNNRIVKTMMDGTGWTTYGSSGTGKGQFNYPTGICFDKTTGYIYISDRVNYRIVKTMINGSGWTTYGSYGTGKGQFSVPYGISFCPSSYYSEGYLTSKVYDCGSPANFITISWAGTTPQNTTIKFQLRTASKLSNLNSKEFIGPAGNNSTYYNASGSTIWSGHNSDRWIQYRVNLSTAVPSLTPVLKDVTIIYNLLPNGPILMEPINNSCTNNNRTTFKWTFNDDDTISQSSFQWQMDDECEFIEIDYDSSQITSATPSFTPDSPLPEGIWYWRVRTKDADGGWGPFSLPWKITIDTTPPNSTITLPINNGTYNNLNTISGTAFDTKIRTGIKKVEIAINSFSDDQFWDGSKWIASETWLVTTGTDDWVYDSSSVTWTSGIEYRIQCRATDNATNIESPGVGNSFIIDTDKPSSTINFPMHKSWVNYINNISGDSMDTGGAGVEKVEIVIVRTCNNYYWAGIDWVPGEFWLPTTGTDNWYYDSRLLSWVPGIQYLVISRAIDNANNIELPSSGNKFTFDLDKPSSTINIPADNATVNNLNKISGYASDIGGSGIDTVEITIKRIYDNNYWDGGAWCQETCWLLADGKESWYYDANDITWTTDTYYDICTRTTDNAGNKKISWDGNTFMYDDTPPELYFSINNGDEYSNSQSVRLYLNSEDSGSGVSQMAFSNDCLEWSDWEEFNTTKMLEFPEPDGTKTVYFRVQDYAGNTAEPIFDSIILDTTPPENVSIVINEGIEYTNSEHVTLSLKAMDSLSGVAQMAFSYKPEVWLGWEPFENRKSITLSSNDGEKIINFRVKDQAENIAYAHDSITLDKTPPHSLYVIINNGTSTTSSTSVTLKLNAIDDTTGVYQMSFRMAEGSWGAWEDYKETTSFVLPAGDGKKTVYFRINDKVGNAAEPVSTMIFLNSTSSKNETHTPDKFKFSFAQISLLFLILFVIIILSFLALIIKRKKRMEQKEPISDKVTTEAAPSISAQTTTQVQASPTLPQLPRPAGKVSTTQQLPQLPPAKIQMVTPVVSTTTHVPTPTLAAPHQTEAPKVTLSMASSTPKVSATQLPDRGPAVHLPGEPSPTIQATPTTTQIKPSMDNTQPLHVAPATTPVVQLPENSTENSPEQQSISQKPDNE